MSLPLDATVTPSRFRTAGLLVLAVWVAFLAVVLVRSYLRPERHSVYPIFANAAREWQESIDIYDPSVPHDDLDRFRYAPIVAVGFIPFAAVPDAIGGVLWRLANVAVLFTGALAFARAVFPGQPNPDRKTLVMLAALLFPLSLGNINNAQSNPLIVGCLLLGTAAAALDRRNLAAVCLAVPVLFKIYPLLVVALVLLVRPRLGWRVGAALVLGCLIPFACQEPQFVVGAYESWIKQGLSDSRHAREWANSYRDFHLLMRIAGLNVAESAYTALQFVMAATVAAILFRGRRLGWPPTRQLQAAFDLGCCWTILFGPATESATYAMLAPTLAFASWEAFQPGRPVWTRHAATLSLVLLVAAVLMNATPWGKSASVYLLPFGASLLFAERLCSFCRHAAWQPVAHGVC